MTVSFGDSPIDNASADRFGRRRIAEAIAKEATLVPVDAGFVMAICGPWGSGKTSVANLVLAKLDDEVIVVRFNPWLFSGAETLLDRFFGELSATLGKRTQLRELAAKVAGYAGGLSGLVELVPVAGGPLHRFFASGAKAAAAIADSPTLEERRADLAEALAGTNRRIVVFLDDLDRLTDNEIREIVRLVKLVGDLPQIIYLLAFDRERVEVALGMLHGDQEETAQRYGRAYLEKIVQSRYDLPPLRKSDLMAFLDDQLATAMPNYAEEIRNSRDWINLAVPAIRDLIKTPRDARRLAMAMSPALTIMGDEVSPLDLIGLQALRVFEPGVHAGLVDISDILMDEQFSLGDKTKLVAENKERIDALLDFASSESATRKLLGALFPAASSAIGSGRSQGDFRRERRERRVSSSHAFRAYLHASLDTDVISTAEAKRLFELLERPADLSEALAGLADQKLDDAIDRLVDRSDEFQPEWTVGAGIEFLKIEKRLRDESPFITRKAPSSWKLHWLLEALVQAGGGEEAQRTLIRELLDASPNLSIRFRLLNWFGSPGEGEEQPDEDEVRLVATESSKLRDELRKSVIAALPADLAQEYMLGPLLAGVLHPDEEAGRETLKNKWEDDSLMLALLGTFCLEQTSLTGEAAPQTKMYLRWDELCQLIDEADLRRRIQELENEMSVENPTEHQMIALDLGGKIIRGEIDPSQERR